MIISFKKVAATKYVATSELALTKIKDKFFICRNNKIPRWQTGFYSISAAETFLNNHDWQNSDDATLKYSLDDFEFLISAYDFKYEDGFWVKVINDDTVIYIQPQQDSITMSIEENGKQSTNEYTDVSDIFLELDRYVDGESIFSSIQLLSNQARLTVIECASKSKSSRELANNLVRVKSSNLWAYGLNVKEMGDTTGDLLIQFKGKKGGPGDIYMYFDVPIKLWRKFLSATSAGHFFWVYIRNNFTYRKLTGDKKTHLKNGV